MTVNRLVLRFITVLLAVATACERGPTQPGPSAGQLDFAPFDEAVQTAIAATGLDGAAAVVVHRELGIVHVEGYGAFDRDRLFLIASAGKPLTAGVLVRLADQGLLDIDEPIGTYVGDSWGNAKASLTVAQLLSNSSGLVGLVGGVTYPPYICQFLVAVTLKDCARAIYDADDADRIVPPDTEFRYGGAQWQLAGGIAEIVSGKSWAQLLRETYVETCGAVSLGFTNPFASSGLQYPPWFQGDVANLPDTENPSIGGGAYITVEDYGRILLMHLRDGSCEHQPALSAAAVARMREDRILAAYGGATPNPEFQGYGLGWWIDRSSDGIFTSPGAYGATPWLDVQRGYAAFIAIEASGADSDAFRTLVPILETIFDDVE